MAWDSVSKGCKENPVLADAGMRVQREARSY